jgi:MoaA/NifB/PqqE/SkfB family radical SAM enzyme
MSTKHNMGRITELYQRVTRLYTDLPYRFSGSGRSFPTWHYFFEITRRCNLRCVMCQYIDWLEETPARVQAEDELTTQEWIDVVNQTGRWSLITFTGGEVFVRKDFMEIFEHACAKRRVHFITNATMLTDDRAKRCVELAPKRLGGRGFSFAGISIDGTQEMHDQIRAQRGAFDRSINGVNALIRFRDAAGKRCPLVHINTVIQEANLECLPELPALCKDVGADVLNLLTEMRSFDLPELGQVDPSQFDRADLDYPRIDRDRLDAALQATMAEAHKLGIEVRMPRMSYESVIDHYDRGYDLKSMECRAIWTNLYVGAKGGVYPCFIRKIGNVREHSLKELRNNDIMRAFRQQRRSNAFTVCRGCCELEQGKQ